VHGHAAGRRGRRAGAKGGILQMREIELARDLGAGLLGLEVAADFVLSAD